MSCLSKIFGLSSVCLVLAGLSSGPLQADDQLGASILFTDSGASLVGSLIQLDGSFDLPSGEATLAAADLRSGNASGNDADVSPVVRARLGMARPQVRSLTTNAAVPPTMSVAVRDPRDAFAFSRVALPMLVESLPGISTTNFAHARPMVGPVVGVRPSYMRPAGYR